MLTRYFVTPLFTTGCLGHTCVALQVPGANAGKPDVGSAAKDAAKKTPFGYMNVGDLAFDLPGSNVKKTDLPDGPKNLFSSGASSDLPSTSDLPNLPSPPGNADKVRMCIKCLHAA